MTEEIKVPGKAGRKPGSRRLTPRQRAEIITLWQNGDTSYEQLMNKFKVGKRALQQIFAKAGVKHGEKAQEVHAQVQEQVNRALNEDASVLATRIKETKEEHYKLSTAIAKMVGKLIFEAAQQGASLATRQNDFKALQAASIALKNAREERFAVLGLNDKDKDKDDDLPELEIREMTAGDIEGMQRQRGDEEIDKGLEEVDKALLKVEREGGIDDGLE